MNLPKAIEIQEKYRKDHHSYPTDIIGHAAQLGIEAMTLVELMRGKEPGHLPALLPSETEE